MAGRKEWLDYTANSIFSRRSSRETKTTFFFRKTGDVFKGPPRKSTPQHRGQKFIHKRVTGR